MDITYDQISLCSDMALKHWHTSSQSPSNDWNKRKQNLFVKRLILVQGKDSGVPCCTRKKFPGNSVDMVTGPREKETRLKKLSLALF